ncbi:MAG: hypothetical protein ACPLXC_03210 [Candidatus Pacearchaeota archaeon]
MVDSFRNIKEWLSLPLFEPSFEDLFYANFKARKERKITVTPAVPVIPPFKSREIDIYTNKNNIFVNAFGKESLFIKNLIYSLRLSYKCSQEPKEKYRFYIFTDNEDTFECPPLFSVISTTKKELYQRIGELRKQIMPEEPLPYTLYLRIQDTATSSVPRPEESYKIQTKINKKRNFVSFLLWLHEKIK